MTDRSAAEEGILEPFLEEWAERARKAQEAIDAILARDTSAPRVERVPHPRTGAPADYVLVRRDAADSHAVTVRFTAEEWQMITLVVLAQHGLQERA